MRNPAMLAGLIGMAGLTAFLQGADRKRYEPPTRKAMEAAVKKLADENRAQGTKSNRDRRYAMPSAKPQGTLEKLREYIPSFSAGKPPAAKSARYEYPYNDRKK